MKKLFTVLLLGAGLNSFSQDIHFTQYVEAPLQINPALTGSFNGEQRAIINFRNQWAAFGSPYKTYSLSFDAGLFKKKFKNAFLGAGLYVYSDNAGDIQFSTTQVNLSLAAHVSLNEQQSISAGLQGGFAQKAIKGNDLRWGNQYQNGAFDPTYDPGEPATFSSAGYGDFNIGIAWNFIKDASTLSSNDNIWAKVGISYFHITRPKQALYILDDKLNSKYLLHAQGHIGLVNTNLGLRPSLLFMNQGKEREFTPGLLLRYMLSEGSKYTGLMKESAISVGAYYRSGDAIAPTLFIEYSNFAFGVNYDFNISKLKAATSGRGGVEVVLRYINPNPFTSQKISNVKFN